jgi:hypothetical protein
LVVIHTSTQKLSYKAGINHTCGKEMILTNYCTIALATPQTWGRGGFKKDDWENASSSKAFFSFF